MEGRRVEVRERERREEKRNLADKRITINIQKE